MKKSTISIVVVVVVLITLVFGCFGYPVAANNDGAWFIVPAIRLTTVHQLDNPVNWLASGVPFNPWDGTQFVSYPPLFEIVIHYFLSPASSIPLPLQTFLVIAFINAIIVILSTWALYLIATADGKRLDWPAVAIISASAFLMLRASWSFDGRPEVLLRLWFTVGLLFYLRLRNSRYLPVAMGIILGLSAATHVLGPIFLFACMVFAFAYRSTVRVALKRTAIALGIGVVTFLLAMQLSPYSLSENLRGIFGVGTWALVRDIPNKPIFGLFFRHPAVLAVLVIFAIAALVWASRFFRSRGKQIGSGILLLFSTFVVFVYVVFCVIDTRTYYLAPFALLAPAALLYIIHRFSLRPRMAGILAAIFVFGVLISLQKIALFPAFLHDGMTMQEARAQFTEITASHPSSSIDLWGSQMWVLSDEYSKMIPGVLPQNEPPEFLRVFEGEEYPNIPQAAIASCISIANFYASSSPKLFGLTIAKVTPGYNFAVYDCHASI